MPETKNHAPGSFCWVDLQTTDVDAAKVFYSELFGWKTEDSPMPGGGSYTMLSVGDKHVAGLGGQPPMMKGAPPVWSSYVAVASADDAAKKATSLGGKVIAPAFDVMDAGRMAVLEDPTGAVFAVWQANKHHGAELWGDAGSVCWNELATGDIKKAGAFYQGLFAWNPDTKDGGHYTEFAREGAPHAGGMIEMKGEMWKGIPPHWMVYFSVDHVDESAKRAERLGGEIKVQPFDIPNVGRFSVLADPQGGIFSIIKLEHHAKS